MIEIIGDALTAGMAEYYREQSGFGVALKFYHQSHTGELEKPCVVFGWAESDRPHPKVLELEVTAELMVQLDDTATDKASEAARGVVAHVPGCWRVVCKGFYERGQFQIRKVNEVAGSSEIEGDRSREWSLSWRVWVKDLGR